jgi:hypothetical protein
MVRKESGERYTCSLDISFGGGGTMGWGCFSWFGLGLRLFFFLNQTLQLALCIGAGSVLL